MADNSWAMMWLLLNHQQEAKLKTRKQGVLFGKTIFFFMEGGGSKWHPRSNVAIIVIREDSGGECSLPVGLLAVADSVSC